MAIPEAEASPSATLSHQLPCNQSLATCPCHQSYPSCFNPSSCHHTSRSSILLRPLQHPHLHLLCDSLASITELHLSLPI
jgi:hypothetical protein